MDDNSNAEETREHEDMVGAASSCAPPTTRSVIASRVVAILVFLAVFYLVRSFTHRSYFVSAFVSVWFVGFSKGCLGLYARLEAEKRTLGLVLAISGITLASVALVVFCVICCQPRGGDDRRSLCQNNLKQLDVVFKMFAAEHPDKLYPPLSPEPGRLMFANDAEGYSNVYPEYLTDLSDLSIMLCPRTAGYSEPGSPRDESDVNFLLDDHSYFYLGYAVLNDDEVEAFAEEYRRRIAEGRGFLDDMAVAQGKGNLGTNTIFRLRDDIERVIHADALAKAQQAPAGSPSAGASVPTSEIPVMIERPDNHSMPGGSVLYLDGHVDFIDFPGRWPMTKKTMSVLKELDAMGAAEPK